MDRLIEALSRVLAAPASFLLPIQISAPLICFCLILSLLLPPTTQAKKTFWYEISFSFLATQKIGEKTDVIFLCDIPPTFYALVFGVKPPRWVLVWSHFREKRLSSVRFYCLLGIDAIFGPLTEKKIVIEAAVFESWHFNIMTLGQIGCCAVITHSIWRAENKFSLAIKRIR